MLIDFIAGTKLDFYKIAPVIDAIHKEQRSGVDMGYRLIYTGRQADYESIIGDFTYLDVPQPNTFLEVAHENPAEFTSTAMVRYDKILQLNKPDIVMVFGHSSGAMACAVAASKDQHVRIAHIEAGLRKRNRYSSDDVNRSIIDAVTDYYFSITQSSNDHLRSSGISNDTIFFVGNTIADFLLKELPALPQPAVWGVLQLQEDKYILLNLEHPSITQNTSRLKSLLLTIIKAARNIPVILPANRELATTLNALGIKAHNLHIIDKPGVAELYYLADYAKAVITDSENLQDETTIMQTPCITLLKSVARPETALTGYNVVTGLDTDLIISTLQKLFTGQWKKSTRPYMWDGKSADKIISVLRKSI